MHEVSWQNLVDALEELKAKLKRVADYDSPGPAWLTDGALDGIDVVASAKKQAENNQLSDVFPLREYFGAWGDIHSELDRQLEIVDALAKQLAYNKSLNPDAHGVGAG